MLTNKMNKKKLTLSVREDLIITAKENKWNLSFILEQALIKLIIKKGDDEV